MTEVTHVDGVAKKQKVEHTNGFTSNGEKSDKEYFMEVYKILREKFLADLPNYEMPEYAQEYIAKMIDYNVPGGKLNRGLTVLSSLRALKEGEPLPDALIFKAHTLGWCIEWLQAFFLVADDVMDSSITRRGHPCWYKVPEVGLNACNDSLILEAMIYWFLRTFFKGDEHYLQLVELFQEVSYKTMLGQLLDLTSQEKDRVDLEKFTQETYNRIVKYKTAFYSFYLPVALGMILADITDTSAFDVAGEILLAMGEYFQVQDDYLDCFGDPKTIGKIGTDIEDNKCGWLIVQALQIASPEQRVILENNYAKKDPDCVAQVKKVYNELNLPDVFAKYETTSYEKLVAQISKVDNVPHAVFTDLLHKIYKRSK